MKAKKEELSRELEIQNATRNNLYRTISREEQTLQKKSKEMSKLLGQKQSKLEELEEKERTLLKKENRLIEIKDRRSELEVRHGAKIEIEDLNLVRVREMDMEEQTRLEDMR